MGGPLESLSRDEARRRLAHALCEGPDGEDWLIALRLADRVLTDLHEDDGVMLGVVPGTEV